MPMDETEGSAPAEAPPHEIPAEQEGGDRLAVLEAETARLKDELLRAYAETENVRRRGERNAQEARAYAIDRFARDLLATADNLGRALEALPADARATADPAILTLIEGVAMTEKGLIDVFARHNLRRTGAKGEAFDSNRHQVVTQIPSDAPAGAVAEVFQPGYVLGDRTLRPAMVAVSAGGGRASATAPDPGSGPAQPEEPAPGEAKVDITA